MRKQLPILSLCLVAWNVSTNASSFDERKNLYRVPVSGKALEAISNVEVTDAAIVDDADRRFEIRYTLPEELTGTQPRLRVRMKATMPNENIVDATTFPLRGIVVEAPCRWPDEPEGVEVTPLCPSLDDLNRIPQESFRIAQARCRWVSPNEKDKSDLKCNLKYASLAEFIDAEKRDLFLSSKFQGEDLDNHIKLASLFAHDAVGEIYLKR